MYRSSCAVFELQNGNGRIFHFYPFMSQTCRGGGYPFYLPGNIQQQINSVDALVHQCAAAVQCPGTAPFTGIVILLCPEPFHLSITNDQFAEPFFFDRGFQGFYGRAEAPVEYPGEHHLVLRTNVNHLSDSFWCHLQRFFTNHMLPRLSCGDRRFQMSS